MLVRWRAHLPSLLAGTAAGVVILGIGGRVLMAVLPMLAGARPRMSWSGSLEVIALGTVYGAVGGALLAVLRTRRVISRGRRGVVLGLILCLLAWAASPVGRATARGAPVSVPIVVLISLVAFVAYGIAAESLAARWEAPETRTPETRTPETRMP